MPAATKTDLIDVTRREWDKLCQLTAALPPDLAASKDADETSIKDILAHRAHWIDLFLGWYRDGQAGLEVAFPAPGYKWSDLKDYNRMLRAEHAPLSWDAVQTRLADRNEALMRFLDGLDQDALYGGPMKGGRNNWTTGRWAEAAGASHYRSAAKYIRARKRAAY